MQQTFQCYSCGAQNNIGQPYCWNCRVRFPIYCPNCQSIVEPTMLNCPNCRAILTSPTQQQWNDEHSPQQPVKKRNNPFLVIALVSFIITAICLILDLIIGPPPDWPYVAAVCAIIFLVIFGSGTFILFIKHIINRKQTNPWRTGFVLLIVVISLCTAPLEIKPLLRE